MKDFYIKTGLDEFLAKIQSEDGKMRYSGSVYFVVTGADITTNQNQLCFCSKSSSDLHDEINEDCRVAFDFSFCWRGVWEGRIYFKDEEYWSEELKCMADAWEKLEGYLKYLIREENPQNLHFDD